MKDYYKILDIEETANAETIYKKYYHLMSKWHPSQSKDIKAYDKFIEIHEAYEILRDPIKRENYDTYCKNCKEAKQLGDTYYRLPLEEIQKQVMKDIGQMVLEIEKEVIPKQEHTKPVSKEGKRTKIDVNDPKTRALIDQLKEELRKDLRRR